MRALLIISLWLCGTLSAAAMDTESGNAFLPGCIAEQENSVVANYPLAYSRGICSGALQALFSVSTALVPDLKFCPPPGATLGQSVRVVVAFLEANPQRLHLPFVTLSIEALRKGWLCK